MFLDHSMRPVLFAVALAGIAALAPQSRAEAVAACKLTAPDVTQAGPGCAGVWFDANLTINEIQTVGTAESYKLAPSPGMLSLMRGESRKDAEALNFAQPPLAQQLDNNARNLEFDIAYDPKGGLFANPGGASMTDEVLPQDYVAAMSRPGFKVIHVLDGDYHSSCLTLIACLRSVQAWSRLHPRHVPIVITLQSNDETTPMPGAVRPMHFNAAAFDALDAEILSVFPRDRLITPDDVQGHYPTLRDAVMALHWPSLGQARGKFLFVLNDTPRKAALYRGQRKSLEGRVMFIATNEKSPAAAFVAIPHPVREAARITADVKAGFMVITRADADTREARSNNT